MRECEDMSFTGKAMEKIDLSGQPLSLDLTLPSGQAFRWRKREDGVWVGVVRDKLMELATDGSLLFWRTYPKNDEALVYDYLRLSDDVNAIYAYLSQSDAHLADLTKRFRGLRMLRQDPTETLLSFICSAANSIPRIMTSIELLSKHYGKLVCEKDGLCYYAFPAVDKLASADAADIRAVGSLGFRGENLKNVAVQLMERGESWLQSLRDLSYFEARSHLLALHGVGMKIADCVSLFSLNKDEAVPVDTHIMQVARRLMLPELKSKSITDAAYRKITQAFIERYNGYAGWAQQFLYYEDLLRTRALGRGLR